jgi:hypothetical protein
MIGLYYVFMFQTVENCVQFPAIGNRYVQVHRMKAIQQNKRKSGQVMLEYVVATCIFLSLVGLSAMLLYAFKSFGGRVLALMAHSV